MRAFFLASSERGRRFIWQFCLKLFGSGMSIGHFIKQPSMYLQKRRNPVVEECPTALFLHIHSTHTISISSNILKCVFSLFLFFNPTNIK